MELESAALSEKTSKRDDSSIASAGKISHAIFRVARVHKMTAALLLREIGLYPNQELLMMRLWDEGPQRQVDLVKYLGTDAPTIARTVRRLERAGFVRINASPTDRRVTIVEATRASLPLKSAVQRIWSELEAATVGSFPTETQEQVSRLLFQVERNLVDADKQRNIGRPRNPDGLERSPESLA
jgi:MarR family transcriptional regulator, organic hydroperoxide resistance regulator